MKATSLYIHLPFCKKICYFCSFYHAIYDEEKVKIYIKKIKQELSKFPCDQFQTIYFGGGTPNCLSPELFELAIATVAPYANEDHEWTIECNPEFIDLNQIKIMKKYGVNRISLGIQSFNDQIIDHVNRQNTKEIGISKIKLLQENGIKNISCDLIYGFHGQTNTMIENDLQIIQQLQIPHLSIYSLEISPNSVFGKQNYCLDDDQIQDQLEFMTDLLTKNGFIQYEVSNWAKSNDFFCRHNLCYWLSNDWVAIGISAYGLEQGNYYHYDGDVINWERKDSYLTVKEWYQQILMMGLRLKNGIDLSEKKYHDAYHFFSKKLSNDRLLEITPQNYLRCKNIYLLNSVLEKILD